MRKAIPIRIPESWRFSDLRLSRTPAGDLSFNPDALRAVLADPADYDWLFSHHEDHLAELLVRLYDFSVAHLGAEDPVVERIIAEIREESR